MNCIRKLAVACLLSAACARAAEEKKDEQKKEPPKITATIPFALIAGMTNTFKVRGQNLTNATALRLVGGQNLAGEIIGRGPAPAPDKARKTNEAQLEVELALPADFPASDLSYVVATPEGETGTNRLCILSRDLLLDEKEPNGGFRTAQPVSIPRTIRGNIEVAADVDVFQFRAKAGDRLRFESLSAGYGSPLDPIITVYDAKGHPLLTRDDSPGTVEALVDFHAPADGVYFVSIIDAHDRGGDNYNYLLILRHE